MLVPLTQNRSSFFAIYSYFDQHPLKYQTYDSRRKVTVFLYFFHVCKILFFSWYWYQSLFYKFTVTFSQHAVSNLSATAKPVGPPQTNGTILLFQLRFQGLWLLNRLGTNLRSTNYQYTLITCIIGCNVNLKILGNCNNYSYYQCWTNFITNYRGCRIIQHNNIMDLLNFECVAHI